MCASKTGAAAGRKTSSRDRGLVCGELSRRLEISGRHTVSEPRLGSWSLNPPEYPVLARVWVLD